MSTATTKKAGLEGVVSRGKLRRLVAGSKIPRAFRPTGFDRVLLQVADAAVESRVPTAIVLPLPGTNVPVLLAATILVDCFVRAGRLSDHVVVVSRNTGLRRFYDSLFVDKDMPVGEYFPRTVVDADGVASTASDLPPERLRKRGRLHFAIGADRLQRLRLKRSPSILTPSGVVIESQACEGNDLRALLKRFGGRVPLVYLTVDPFDPALKLFRALGAVWAWDGAHISSFVSSEDDGDALCTGSGLLAGAARTAFEVLEPQTGTVLDGVLARLWEDLVEVRRNPFGPDPESTGWAWGTFTGLSQLVVPLDAYDQMATIAWNTASLSAAPGRAAAFSSNAVGEAAELWEILSADLDEAVDAARRDNPKPRLLSRWVVERLEERSPGLLIVRNRAAKRALEVFLEEDTGVPFGWKEAVEVATLAGVASGRESLHVPQVLFAGPLAPWHGWMFALPAARRVSVLAHGPWEARRIVSQVHSVARRLTEVARGEDKQEALRLLFSGHAPGGERRDSEAPEVPVVARSVSSVPKVPAEVADAVWSPFDVKVARSLRSTDENSVVAASSVQEGIASGTAEVLMLTFEDGCGYFEPNCLVSKLKPGGIEDVAAKSLRPGDRVVLVEHGARRDLFGVITKRLEDTPEMALLVLYAQEWRERAREAGRACALDCEQILGRMGGTDIKHPATIAGWIRGTVIGPNKAQDIRRFGAAVGDEFLIREWETVGKAITTIRGHRIKMGQMLNSAISGLSVAEMKDSGYFDRRLGIHFSDLAEAVSVHVVVSVSSTTTTVPQLQANKLVEPKEESIQW